MTSLVTFGDAIAANAARTPDAPFVLAPEADAALTFEQLAAACTAFAATLEDMGYAPGDVVGFMLPNGLSALTVFLGAMAGGYVVAPFNLLAQDAHLDFVLDHARPRVVFSSAEFAGRLRDACARVGAKTRIVEVGVDGLALGRGAPRTTADVTGDTPAMLMYTSGTTGLPKGVLLTHASMLYAGAAVAEHQSLRASDRVLSSLPLYHINGQCIATTSTLVSGGSIVMPHRFSASQWWPLVERYRPTWLNVVPTIIAYLLNGPDPTPAQRKALAERPLRALGLGAAVAGSAARVRVALRHSRDRGHGADRVRVGRVLQPDEYRRAQDRQPGASAGGDCSHRFARWRDAPRRRGRTDRDQGSERHARVFPRAAS